MQTKQTWLRRAAALLLAAVLCFQLAAPALAAGDDDTFYIGSTADLLALAQNCALDSWSQGKTVVLQTDLSLQGVEFEPIPSFSGTFQGNGHTIRGLQIDGSYAPAGLFARVEEGAVISSLRVQGSVAPAGTGETVGGIAGVNRGTLTGCQFSGVVQGESEVGGVVGRNEAAGALYSCASYGAVNGDQSTGGIVGYNLGAVSGCTNHSAVNADYAEQLLSLDGLQAEVLDTMLSLLRPDGSTSEAVAAASDTGGIAGRSSGLLLSCTNLGGIGHEHIGYNVGGIVGRTDGQVSACTNGGRVLGRKDVGGIAGQAEPYIELDLSQSTLERLRTELQTLNDMVTDAANELDGNATALHRDMDALNNSLSQAVDAADLLTDQGSDYLGEVADEIDRTGVLVSDALGRLEPALDTGSAAMDNIADGITQLKWCLRELSVESGLASYAIQQTKQATGAASDAMGSAGQALDQISRGLDQLKTAVGLQDETAAQQAADLILTGYGSLPADAIDDGLRTAISLLQLAGTAASLYTGTAGLDEGLQLLSLGLGALRTGSILADTGASQQAGAQVLQALGMLAGFSDELAAVLRQAAGLAGNMGHSEIAHALELAAGALDGTTGALDILEDVLGQLGFDTGSIHTGAGSIQSGLRQLKQSARDLETAAGYLDDAMGTLQLDTTLMSVTMQHMSLSMDMMEKGIRQTSDMIDEIGDVVGWLADQDPIRVPRPDSAMQDTTDALFDSVSGMSTQLGQLNDDMLSLTGSLTDQVRGLSDQLNVVTNLLLDAVEELQDTGNKVWFEDVSDEDLAAMTDGKIEDCLNQGTIEADVNVGGVAGAMALENVLDPEDDLLQGSTFSLSTVFATRAALQNCVNQGVVTSKKNAAGGICGRMDLGIASGCEAYGAISSTSGSQVGGIAGLSSSTIRGCWAKCTLSGANYIGGIVGQGAHSDLTDAGCVVQDCRSMVQIDEGEQFLGAIAGSEEGTYRSDRFVSDTLRGTDRISRAGQAEPVTYEELLADEALPEAFRQFTLSFVVDDQTIKTVRFAYGDSFDESVFPDAEMPEDDYCQWDRDTLQDLRFDTVVTGEAVPYTTTLSGGPQREGGHAAFLALGQFLEQDSLTVQPLAAEDVPTLTGKNGSAAEYWQLILPDDGAAEHTLRYLPEEGSAEVYLLDGGSWRRLDTSAFGQYLAFTAAGSSATLAIVQHSAGASLLWLLLLVLVLAALAVAAVLLRRRRHKQTQAAGTGAETPVK